jgi:hypothetical protein
MVVLLLVALVLELEEVVAVMGEGYLIDRKGRTDDRNGSGPREKNRRGKEGKGEEKGNFRIKEGLTNRQTFGRDGEGGVANSHGEWP